MSINSTRMLQFYQNFGKFYTRQFFSLTQSSGLSARELEVLLFLANNPGYDTARDMTLLRGMSKSQVSQAVDLLSAEGLLLRTPDMADRRIIHLSITESGQGLTRQALAIQRSCIDRLLSGLSPEEQVHLFSALGKVLDNAALLAEESDT